MENVQLTYACIDRVWTRPHHGAIVLSNVQLCQVEDIPHIRHCMLDQLNQANENQA